MAAGVYICIYMYMMYPKLSTLAYSDIGIYKDRYMGLTGLEVGNLPTGRNAPQRKKTTSIIGFRVEGFRGLRG